MKMTDYMRDFYLYQNSKDKAELTSVGIDGCRGGWIAVSITDDGYEAGIYSGIAEICSKYADSGSLMVDMPIGLPEYTDDIRPDSEARTYLRGRTSCIFNTPCRQAIYEDDYFRASQINRLCLGKGLSRQSFAICKQIREIDDFLEKNPVYKGKLRESHPEVCFAVLTTMDDVIKPQHNSKHTEEGFWDRVNVLEEFYNKTREFVSFISSHSVLRKYKVDCIDALCLAVSGLLGLRNGFASIPDTPLKDRRGLNMEIVYGRSNKARYLQSINALSISKISMLEKAIQIAVKAHEGQKDKAGQPYILHPLRVMLRTNSEIERICAVLHDVIEDTPITLEMLKDEGFSPEVLATLENLTKRHGESYDDFISRILENETACNVKLADLADNMDLSRLQTPSEEDYKRVEKYKMAVSRIQQHLIGIKSE